MEFSRPEYWSGQPFPSPGDLPNPGIKPRSPTLHEYHSGEQSHNESFSSGSDSIESALNVGDPGSTPSSRRFPGFPREGNGDSFQYSCLENYMENPTDRGAWQAIVHGVAKSQT